MSNPVVGTQAYDSQHWEQVSKAEAESSKRAWN